MRNNKGNNKGNIEIGRNTPAFFIKTLLMALSVLFIAGWPAVSHAASGRPSVNYGAYCMSSYGHAGDKTSVSKAIKALESYFEKKGLEARVISHTNRIIRADIFKGSLKVDGVVMDIRTGRLRSIY